MGTHGNGHASRRSVGCRSRGLVPRERWLCRSCRRDDRRGDCVRSNAVVCERRWPARCWCSCRHARAHADACSRRDRWRCVRSSTNGSWFQWLARRAGRLGRNVGTATTGSRRWDPIHEETWCKPRSASFARRSGKLCPRRRQRVVSVDPSVASASNDSICLDARVCPPSRGFDSNVQAVDEVFSRQRTTILRLEHGRSVGSRCSSFHASLRP